MKIDSRKKLESLAAEARKKRAAHPREVLVCAGTGCLANGSAEVLKALDKALQEAGFPAKTRPFLKTTGCHGFCERGPLVVIQPEGIFYQRVKPKDAREIVEETVASGRIVERLLYKDPNTKQKITRYDEIPFYAQQHRVALGRIGRIDPAEIPSDEAD